MIKPIYVDQKEQEHDRVIVQERMSLTDRVLQTLGNIDKLNIVKQGYSLSSTKQTLAQLQLNKDDANSRSPYEQSPDRLSPDTTPKQKDKSV